MVKKIAAIAVGGAILLSVAMPVFADKPNNPGCIGEGVSTQGKAGTRADVVASVKATTSEKNFGQAIQAWKGPACGIPPAHTP